MGPILFSYYQESLVSSNLNSKLFQFHIAHPNVHCIFAKFFSFSFLGIQVVDKAVGLELRIIKFPLINAVSVEVQKQLQRYVLSTVVRMQQKQGFRYWRIEMAFVGNPVAKINQTKTRQVSYLTIEVGNSESIGEAVDTLLQEWAQVVHLFELGSDFLFYIFSQSSQIFFQERN